MQCVVESSDSVTRHLPVQEILAVLTICRVLEHFFKVMSKKKNYFSEVWEPSRHLFLFFLLKESFLPRLFHWPSEFTVVVEIYDGLNCHSTTAPRKRRGGGREPVINFFPKAEEEGTQGDEGREEEAGCTKHAVQAKPGQKRLILQVSLFGITYAAHFQKYFIIEQSFLRWSALAAVASPPLPREGVCFDSRAHKKPIGKRERKALELIRSSKLLHVGGK